jgi:hypothetical protein
MAFREQGAVNPHEAVGSPAAGVHLGEVQNLHS